MRRIAPLLVLLASSASASPLSFADVTSQSILHEGTIHAEADLLAYAEAFSQTPASASRWSLEAGEVQVRVDYAARVLRIPPVVDAQREVGNETYTLQNASGAASGNHAPSWLGIFAVPGQKAMLHTDLSCLGVRANATGIAKTQVFAESRSQTPVADLSRALTLEACHATPFTVTGSFIVVLWEWTGSLTSAAGDSRQLRTGQRQSGETPYATAAQAYLSIQDGRLTFTPSVAGRAFAADLKAQVRGASTYSSYTIHIASHDEAHGTTFRLTGQFNTTTQRTQDATFSHVAGQVQANADGQMVALAVAPSEPEPFLQASATAFWLILLALTGAAALWLLRLKRERRLTTEDRNLNAEGHIQRGEDLLRSGSHRFALLHLRHALLLEPEHPYAHQLLGQCHHALNHRHRALKHSQQAHRLLAKLSVPEDQALGETAYLASRILATLGHYALALDWLNLAVRSHPVFAKLAGTEPDFFNLREHPAYCRLLMGPIDLHRVA